MPEEHPFLVVIAGPNGSGKTSLTTYLRSKSFDFGLYINPDDIAAELSGSYDERVRKAQQLADERRAEAIAARRNFSFETVFSHPSKLNVLDQAHLTGFEITLFFVAVESPNISLERVRTRVITGGHDVPEDRIVARYARTMSLLPQVMKRVDHAFIFDNSATSVGPIVFRGRLVATMSDRNLASLKIRGQQRIPGWVQQYVILPARRRGWIPIATPRLELRPPRLEDAPALANLANDRRVVENMGRLPFPFRISDAEKLIVSALESQDDLTYVIVLSDGTPIGVCGLVHDRDPNTLKLECWLGAAYWGRGYATEAVRALIDETFTQASPKVLVSDVRVTNHTGRRLLEKCAFQWIGVGLERIRSLGSAVPVDRFRLDRGIWLSLKSWK
jgi:predicted ABC-type ATPase/RimJ/RimL family protein N-acetyltransferase